MIMNNEEDGGTLLYSGGELDEDEEEVDEIAHLIVMDGVTHIPDCAFEYWNRLKTIQISNTVISIGEYAFRGCESLESITFSESLISIGEDAFAECDFLISVTFPKSLLEIDDNAFYYCALLSSVNIPQRLKRIGENAFGYCSALLEINLPKSLIDIGEYAFDSCQSLRKIEIPPSIMTINNNTFCLCEELTKIKIPPSVTEIQHRAFFHCSSLKSLKLHNALEIIGDQVFCRCNSLESIQIPSSTTSIGEWAFGKCNSMKIIFVPSAAIQGAENVFDECNTNIIILSDAEGFEYESRPTLSLQGIQRCLNDLPNVIPTSQQILALHQALYQQYPPTMITQSAEPAIEQTTKSSKSNLLHQVISFSGHAYQTLSGLFLNKCPHRATSQQQAQNLHDRPSQGFYSPFLFHQPTIAQSAEISQLTLLHLLVYFPGDIYHPLLELLNKCPQATIAVDDKGKTPLHHAIVSTRHNMDTRCYELLRQRSPNHVVNLAIQSKSPWEDVMEVVNAKIDGLRDVDEKSGLMPFMLAAGAGDDSDLTVVYELLCLQPDVIKKYVDLPIFNDCCTSGTRRKRGVVDDEMNKRCRIEQV